MKRLCAALLLLSLVVGLLCGCTQTPAPTEATQATEATQPTEASQATEATEPTQATVEEVDYAGQLELDMKSGTAKQEVTVKMFIDGDTTHFFVPNSVMSNGVLKARYLAVNTPESTGVIEEYGKKASNFTKEKLSSATSIIIESESAQWEADSTGDRYLSWVWYKPEGSDTYRNLNVELLQNGLAIASNSANNRYGDTCMAALNQAKALKLNVHSGQKDPDFYYGEAVELTLKELRANIEKYEGMKVAFNGVVTVNDNNSVYVESYDAESDMYYGMAVYYGYNLNGQGLDILNVGNEVRIVGSVQYYEAGGTWQVSDLNYRLMKPDDPNNIQLISQGNPPAFRDTDPVTFTDGEITIQTEEDTLTRDFAAMAMSTSVSMDGLYVADVYTTTNEDSASKGAMTLTCYVDGVEVDVRTTVLRDENGQLITESAYLGKTISVKGIVDYFSGSYQIKVFSASNITVTG